MSWFPVWSEITAAPYVILHGPGAGHEKRKLPLKVVPTGDPRVPESAAKRSGPAPRSTNTLTTPYSAAGAASPGGPAGPPGPTGPAGPAGPVPVAVAATK